MSSPASSPVSKRIRKQYHRHLVQSKVDKDKEAELQSWTTKNARYAKNAIIKQ